MNKVIDKIISIRDRKKKSSEAVHVEEKAEVQKAKRVKSSAVPKETLVTEDDPVLQFEAEEVEEVSKPRRSRTSTTSN